MATKAGMVQAKDIKQGRTFYEVTLKLKEHGEDEFTIRPIYCGSRLWTKKLKPLKKLQDNNHAVNTYRDKPLFSFGYRGFEKETRDSCGNRFFGSYSRSFNSSSSISFDRLFATKKAAERFVENMRLTFRRSGEQDYYVIYYYRWQRDWEEEQMKEFHERMAVINKGETHDQGCSNPA